jgi:hypothetical protein
VPSRHSLLIVLIDLAERKGALDNAEADGEGFDIAVEDAIADRPAKRSKDGKSDKSRMPRTARDQKFGFGSGAAVVGVVAMGVVVAAVGVAAVVVAAAVAVAAAAVVVQSGSGRAGVWTSEAECALETFYAMSLRCYDAIDTWYFGTSTLFQIRPVSNARIGGVSVPDYIQIVPDQLAMMKSLPLYDDQSRRRSWIRCSIQGLKAGRRQSSRSFGSGFHSRPHSQRSQWQPQTIRICADQICTKMGSPSVSQAQETT